MTLFSEKALNNLLWHRRCLRVLVVETSIGTRFVTCSKKKEAIRIFQKRFAGCKGYIIRVIPNAYRPDFLITRNGGLRQSKHRRLADELR
jgi:hypothetical protein